MTKSVATKSSGAVQPWMENMERDSGKGVSSRQEDNLIPMMRILQALSPQVNSRNPAYVKGAEAGVIFVRGLPSPVMSGEEGVIFQPCHFTKKWVEWVPRAQGGGLVDRYDDCPADAVFKENKEGKKVWVRPNGNEVVETRYHSGYLIDDDSVVPVVLPLSSTGHSFSKEWMLSFNMKKTPLGKKAPSFAYLYRLTTKPRANASGEWFTWSFEDAGMVQSEEEYNRGRDLHDAIAEGTKAFDETREDHDDTVV
jgi:hypothetical protein